MKKRRKADQHILGITPILMTVMTTPQGSLLPRQRQRRLTWTMGIATWFTRPWPQTMR